MLNGVKIEIMQSIVPINLHSSISINCVSKCLYCATAI